MKLSKILPKKLVTIPPMKWDGGSQLITNNKMVG
jgi:hypothetical protein